MNGLPVRSCSIPVSASSGAKITTIEGLASGKTLHKVQKAWIDHDVPQCGYCQSGMIMAGGGPLQGKPKPADARHAPKNTKICPPGPLPPGAGADPPPPHAPGRGR